MDPQSQPDKESEIQKEKFVQVFGVSEEQLISQGINPDEYVRENIRKALQDKRVRELLLPPSSELGRLWRRWALRGYMGMYIGIGFLALSIVHDLHWIGIALACMMLIFVIYTYMMSLKYHHKYVRACEQEHINPNRHNPFYPFFNRHFGRFKPWRDPP